MNMGVAIVTGSAGLVGSEVVRHVADKGMVVVGIDNDMRSKFFGNEASTHWQRVELEKTVPNYTHVDADIRDEAAMENLFRRYGRDIAVVVHCAAQPSHDWAARDRVTDFTINANGTLTLLEASLKHCPETVFIFTSTNKVYGNRPNFLPLVELETRYEVAADHPFAEYGIDESMPLDQCLHSFFGASKVAADIMVQEFGLYCGLKTACFRGGCLTGPAHSGAQLHGFLAYLLKCAVTDTPYTIFGYQGKQVRDNIHSKDLAEAFCQFFLEPRVGEVFNIGGGRDVNCSVLEAIAIAEELTGRPMKWSYDPTNRVGDHIWWISDVRKFQTLYPNWKYNYGLRRIMQEIYTAIPQREKN